MNRRRFLLISLAGAVAAPLAAGAQQAARIARVGYLTFNRAAGDPRSRDAFKHGMRDLGYVEGP